MEATNVGDDSTIAQIVCLIEQAQTSKVNMHALECVNKNAAAKFPYVTGANSTARRSNSQLFCAWGDCDLSSNVRSVDGHWVHHWFGQHYK